MLKKIFYLILLISLLASLSFGQTLIPYPFPFTGKWNPSESPLLIDDYGFQDVQNVRKDGRRFKGVNGHTAVNSTALSSYPYILNGFHFRKDQPQESHVIVYAADSMTPTAGRLYQNATAIPGAGDFSGAALYTPAAFNETWNFSAAPGGNMIAANGGETLIWGGNEIEATSFITSSAAVTYVATNANDYSNILNNTRQTSDQVATLLSNGGIDSSTVLMLHMDGSGGSTAFTDSSLNGRAVTVTGNARIDTAQIKFGTAAGLFDGAGDDITVADSADFDFGSGNLTIDFWVRFNSVSGDQSLYSHYSGAYDYVYLYHDSANGWQLRRYSSGSAIVNFGESGAPASANTWYHIALVRNGNVWTIYKNGAAAATQTVSATWGDYSGTPRIGGFAGTGQYFNGWVDEYRVTKGAARWTANFTPPTQPYGNASNNFLVGSKRPLQGVKFYVQSGNATTSALTVKEWQGASWTALSVTDGTASGGKTLAQTGSVSWTYTGNAVPRYINGLSLYWYQFNFDAGQASIYYVTTDAPIQPIRNIWDGAESYAVKVLKYANSGAKYTDYTAETGDSSLSTYANINALGTSDAIYIGFVDPQQALDVTFVAGAENTNTAALTAAFWNGSEWQECAAFNDGTSSSSKAFNKGGVISFQGAPEGTEFKRAISDEYPLYYYRLTVGAALSATVYIGEIRGIPAPPAVASYKFARMFQNRTFLFNEKSGAKNKALYSVANSPDIYNGDDAGEIYFGDRTDLVAAATVYNIFQNTAVEQLIVAKKNETWRLSGSSPDDWVLQKMSGNIGCVAPLSMVSAEVTTTGNDVARSVAIWVSDRGPVMSDGATILPIGEEIKCYWDANDARYIPAAMQPRSFGWYDTKLKSYKLLIASGASATYLNTELEYSLVNKEWTKIYRENAAGANPLQSGFPVWDTGGVGHTYGGGRDGFVYRLENGNNWNGVANITSYLHTKDFIPDNQAGLLRKSTVKYIRTAYKKKGVGNITLSHYGDGALTVSGVSGQFGPSVITSAATTNYNTQSTNLGPFLYHSFKFSATTNTADGLELTGFGLYADPSTTIR